MKEKTKFRIWFLPALVVFVIGFTAATLWDLEIAKAVFNQNAFGIIMEAFCWYPAFLPVLFFAILLVTQAKDLRPHPLLSTGGWAVLIVGMLGMALMSIRYLKKRSVFSGDSKMLSIILVAFAIAFGLAAIIGTAIATSKIKGRTREKLYFFGIFGTAYALANQIVIYLLKFVWQRPRFEEMATVNDYSSFTAWFQPFSSGGSSFPSGHTANSAGIFVLIVLCDLFISWGKKRALVYIVCWAYVAISGFSRMLMGRHFLSDILAATAIMALLFFALRSTNIYQNTLRRLNGAAANAVKGDT